jgi:hypothetical protein
MRRYYIYQLPHNNPNLFRHFKEDQEIDLGDYVPTWTDECGYQNDLEICEKLFEKFNLDHPNNFAGHSMSVSDIVVIVNGRDDVKAYYCDAIGFKEIKNFKK